MLMSRLGSTYGVNAAPASISLFLLRVCQELDRVEQLQSKLYSYSRFGLPKVPQQLSFHQDSWEEEEEEEETNLAMEDSWQMLLDDPQVQTWRASVS